MSGLAADAVDRQTIAINRMADALERVAEKLNEIDVSIALHGDGIEAAIERCGEAGAFDADGVAAVRRNAAISDFLETGAILAGEHDKAASDPASHDAKGQQP